MSNLAIKLLQLYLPLVGGVFLGWLIGGVVSKDVPAALGKFLFWVGVPIGIVAFVRGADLSGSIWIAPLVAWAAILLGGAIAIAFIAFEVHRVHLTSPAVVSPLARKPTQGSFLLASMVGNTGYLGFPVTLAIVGQQYFGWALFYDLLGTMFGAYGLGVVMAARFGKNVCNCTHLARTMLTNPALWSFGLALAFKDIPLPAPFELGLKTVAWIAIALSLILIGMRLSHLSSWRGLPHVWICLAIKMLVVPLILGYGLQFLGLSGATRLVIVLQMAMPPAFATLLLGEAFHLDRDLTVAALAIGSIGFLFMLPLWLLLFGTG
jgi:malate permease and related proteins